MRSSSHFFKKSIRSKFYNPTNLHPTTLYTLSSKKNNVNCPCPSFLFFPPSFLPWNAFHSYLHFSQKPTVVKFSCSLWHSSKDSIRTLSTKVTPSTASIPSNTLSSKEPSTPPISTSTSQKINDSFIASEHLNSEEEAKPDLEWFVDPLPDQLPRWLRSATSIASSSSSSSTSTSLSETRIPEIQLPDASPTSLQTYLTQQYATNVNVLDLTSECDLWDTLIIATLMHPGHLRSVAQQLKKELKRISHVDVHFDGLESQEWIAIDLGRIMIHLFTPEARTRYAMDSLWEKIKDHYHRSLTNPMELELDLDLLDETEENEASIDDWELEPEIPMETSSEKKDTDLTLHHN